MVEQGKFGRARPAVWEHADKHNSQGSNTEIFFGKKVIRNTHPVMGGSLTTRAVRTKVLYGTDLCAKMYKNLLSGFYWH